MSRSAAILAGGAAVLLAVAIYVVKHMIPARSFTAQARQIGNEVARQLSELRPDLTDAQRAMAGAIVAAQAAEETDSGNTPAWVRGWNFSNLTAGPYWHGATVTAGDTAPDASGNYIPISQQFRAYSSLAAAVSDYITALGWTPYRAARDALFAGDAAGFVAALHAGGWFTAPLADYQSAVAYYLPKAQDALG